MKGYVALRPARSVFTVATLDQRRRDAGHLRAGRLALLVVLFLPPARGHYHHHRRRRLFARPTPSDAFAAELYDQL